MRAQKFGGNWTEDKLNCLYQYLKQYKLIFDRNPRAKYFTTIYFDAFAGSGYRENERKSEQKSLFGYDKDAESYLKGSPIISLELDSPFHKYYFVEKNPDYSKELQKIVLRFEKLKDRISIINRDANDFIIEFCQNTDWKKSRAVMFLDPYGMQIEWAVLREIANTQAIDLWLLFPLGVGVNRLLMKGEIPRGKWAEALKRLFGNDCWKDFYSEEEQPTLFGPEKIAKKTATIDDIGKCFVDRLKTIFCSVTNQPLKLFNSKNNPIFLLIFASNNKKSGKVALRIAEYIINSKRK